MITEKHVEQAFLALQVAGVRAPDVYANPTARDMGIRMFLAAFNGRTRSDLERAVRSYVAQPNPFWPTPGQLLELVPAAETTTPAALAARGERLHEAVLLAASTAAREPARFAACIEHYARMRGMDLEPGELAACLSVHKHPASVQGGEPGSASHRFAVRDFGLRFAAALPERRREALELEAAPMTLLEATERQALPGAGAVR